MNLGSAPNDYETEFIAACEELYVNCLGLDGPAYVLQLETWERKYRDHPRIGHSCRNHIRGMQSALCKSPGSPMVNVQGDNNQIQCGANNVAQVGSNLASDNSSAVAGIADGDQKAQSHSSLSRATFYGNVATGIASGLLAVWWCLPQEWAIGPVRFLVTVFICVATFVIVLLSWWQHSRSIWEWRTYAALGSVMLLRAAAPSVVGSVAGAFGFDQGEARADVNAYLGIAKEGTAAAVIVPVAAGLFLLGLAFLSRRAPISSS